MERDYTGVAAWQFAEVFNALNLDKIDLVAMRIPPRGMDVRDLKKIVTYETYRFTGLHSADRIMLGIGQNISALINAGHLTIIPVQGKIAPFKMAEDEFWAKNVEPTDEEFQARAIELALLRDEMLR